MAHSATPEHGRRKGKRAVKAAELGCGLVERSENIFGVRGALLELLLSFHLSDLMLRASSYRHFARTGEGRRPGYNSSEAAGERAGRSTMENKKQKSKKQGAIQLHHTIHDAPGI